MLLIETDNFSTLNEYLLTLKKSARKNYREGLKRYPQKYESVSFDKEEVHRFMQLWERQLVRGNPIQWAFPVEHIETLWSEGNLLCFRLGDVAYHFIQRRANYWECHPPMYDKQNEYLGTLMWFHLIEYAIENRLGILNFGGGNDESWRTMIRERDSYPNPKYKWRFVPESVKDNPDKQPDYRLQDFKLWMN